MVFDMTGAEAEAIRDLADRRGRPFQEVVTVAFREYVERDRREELLEQVLDSELPRYADALRRLGE